MTSTKEEMRRIQQDITTHLDTDRSLYDFRSTDFIPIFGLENYCKRTNRHNGKTILPLDDRYSQSTQEKAERNGKIIENYNALLIVAVIVGSLICLGYRFYNLANRQL